MSADIVPDDFSDRRIFVCRPGDSRLGFLWSESGGLEQSCDGPIFIVVGIETTDEDCADLAARVGIDAADLIAFRSTTALKSKQLHVAVHAAA